MGFRWVRRGVIPFVVGITIGFSLSLILRLTANSCRFKKHLPSSESVLPIYSFLSSTIDQAYGQEPHQIVNLVNSEDSKLESQTNTISAFLDHAEANDQNLVLVGVMTARKYIHSRAVGVFETWGQTLPGKVIFFTGGSANTSEEIPPPPIPSIPLIELPGVDDSYPPQKKSFMMLK
jgi:chondroitin sulfate synthase